GGAPERPAAGERARWRAGAGAAHARRAQAGECNHRPRRSAGSHPGAGTCSARRCEPVASGGSDLPPMKRSARLLAAAVLAAAVVLALSWYLHSWGGVALVAVAAAGFAWYRVQVARGEA